MCSAGLQKMILTTCIWLITKVKEGFSKRLIEERRGCDGLPAKRQAEQKPTKNNLLHVKENFKSVEIAVFGLFRIPWAKRTASSN
jgi:hypothetical protein